MRTSRFLSVLGFLLLSGASGLFAQAIDIGDAVRTGKGTLPVAVQSADPAVQTLARRAFGLHGGYSVVTTDQAAFIFSLEPAGSAVTLVVSSGRPAQEQLRRTVNGASLQEATLKACDLAVQATLKLPGFFSGKLAFVGKQRGVTEIYTADFMFTRVRSLTSDRALVVGPDWSPDGSQILYTTYYRSGFPDIYKIDLRSGQRTPIATFKGTNAGAEFSPDGRRITMALSGTGNSEIYVSDANGRSMKRLTNNRSLEAAPSWSPDGRRIVFSSDERGKPQLYEISATGGPSRIIRTNVSNYCSEPQWNPRNDKQIVFTAAVGNGFQLALYDAATGGSKILTSVRNDAIEPSWLNDGRHIIFTQRTDGKKRLMLLDSESGKVSPLHSPSFGEASSASFVY